MDYGDLSHPALELTLYMENDPALVRREKVIFAALDKKSSRGKYDPSKASKFLLPFFTEVAKRYSKEFGGSWSKNFSVADRKQAADFLRRHYEGTRRERMTAHRATY